jgi:hypothetical protein
MVAGGDLPLGVVAVADHQPPAVLVDLVGERLDIRGSLGPQRPPHATSPSAHPQVLIIALSEGHRP